MSIPVDPASTSPAPNSAEPAVMPYAHSPGAVTGTTSDGELDAYFEPATVDDFSKSTFSNIRDKSEKGGKSVGRADASALGDFPEAQTARGVHERIRQSYLRRFGQLTRGITGSQAATDRMVVQYIEVDNGGRKLITRIHGQGV